jgi:myo-inositol 2-dehydrogenase / D-chiro-inositol 1-dehydrogenase
MGRRYLQVFRDLGLDLVGICDQSSDSLALASSEWELPSELLAHDAAPLLEKTQPQVVIVATTAPSHCAYTCLAAEAGAKYILTEKPMAVSLAECDRMLATCKMRGAELAINLSARYLKAYSEPKCVVESEAFGGLTSVSIIAGNLGIAMNGSHFFEMFRYLTDEAPVEVTAWFSEERTPNPRGPQFEDRAGSVRLTTASGKRLYLEAGADQGHGVLTVYAGRFGQMTVDFQGTMRIAVRDGAYRHLPTTNYAMPEVSSTQITEDPDVIAPTRATLRALLNGEGPPSGAEGRLALAVLLAAYLSDENGHVPIRLQDVEQYKDRVFPWA